MKILLIAMSGIGDTLIATPLLHELRANFPGAEIDVLVMWAGAKDLLEGNPHVNRVWQKNFIKEGALRSFPYLLRVRGERYDVSLNAHTQGRVAYRTTARFIGATLRVSHAYDNTRAWERWLIHRTVPEDYSVHSVENNNRLLPLVGAKPLLANHTMELYLGQEELDWAAGYTARHGLDQRKCLGIHVGSGGTKNLALKRWPLDHYIALLKKLTAGHPELAILLFGGPEEQPAHARIRAEIASPNVLIPDSKNLRQAGALMKHCRSFLSVDTALMHLAAAMKIPNQVVIEAPTLNPTNYPHGNPFKLVRNPAVNGRNLEYYRYDGGPIKGTDAELVAAMSSVTVDKVLEAVQEGLSR